MTKTKKSSASVIMMAMTIIRRVLVVLDFPGDLDDFIFYAKEIHDSMTNASYFGALAGKLAALKNDTDMLTDAQTGLHTAPPTHTTADRNVALQKVKDDLRSLGLDVQALADADHDNAENIIKTAGMKIKKPNLINKQNFKVVRGKLTGTVVLIAKGIRGRHAHCWEMSQDGTHWITIMATLSAKTTVSGLTKGSIWNFRHCYILKDGPTDWLYSEDIVIA